MLEECKDNLLAVEVVHNDYVFPDEYIKTGLNLPKIIGSDTHLPEEIARYYCATVGVSAIMLLL